MFGMLHRIPEQAKWTDFVPGKEFSLCDAEGQDSGLRCLPRSLSDHYPSYVTAERRARLSPGEASLGFFISSNSGARLAYMPAVPRVDHKLLAELNTCDVVLFDGTFWSNTELMSMNDVQRPGPTAQEMGHVPVHETLVELAELRRPRRIFLHINNTNPMLDEASAQYRGVREAGWEIAEDGWQFVL